LCFIFNNFFNIGYILLKIGGAKIALRFANMMLVGHPMLFPTLMGEGMVYWKGKCEVFFIYFILNLSSSLPYLL
jgi:hypothetical protein